MTTRTSSVWWFATIVLLALMCLAAAAMAVEAVIYADIAGRDTVVRFALVAASPFVWAALVALWHRRGRGPASLLALSTLMFIAFVGAVDWANGRPLYSWVSPPLG